MMQVVNCQVQRRVIVCVLESYVAFPLQQQVHGLHVAAEAGVVHRRVLTQPRHKTINWRRREIARRCRVV